MPVHNELYEIQRSRGLFWKEAAEELSCCLRSSFNSFIGAGSIKVSVCPEYPVLTRVFCSTARPSSTSSCSAPWSVAWSCTWPRSCISESALTAAWSPPVSPPTRTGPVSTIIFGNKKTFSYCCVQAAAGATAGRPPPRTRTPACRRLSTTGWRPATWRGRLSTARAPPHLIRVRPGLRVRGGRGAVRHNYGPHPSFPTMSP